MHGWTASSSPPCSSAVQPSSRCGRCGVGEVKDDAWLNNEFITSVQQRSAAVKVGRCGTCGVGEGESEHWNTQDISLLILLSCIILSPTLSLHAPSPQARGLSSALSAASSACDHVRDWVLGTPADGSWVSMGVVSDGSYDTPAGLVYSFPVTCKDGKWSIVQVCESQRGGAKGVNVMGQRSCGLGLVRMASGALCRCVNTYHYWEVLAGIGRKGTRVVRGGGRARGSG